MREHVGRPMHRRERRNLLISRNFLKKLLVYEIQLVTLNSFLVYLISNIGDNEASSTLPASTLSLIR